MYKIIQEYEYILTEYLVEASTDAEAKECYRSGHYKRIDKVPKTLSLEVKVRSMSQKDEKEMLVKQAQNQLEVEALPVPEKPKRVRKAKAVKSVEDAQFFDQLLKETE